MDQKKEIERAVELLKRGQLVAIPTETVYGLGADASNAAAVEKIYAAKGRPASNPLIVHIARAEMMEEWAIDIPESAWKLARAFWPGPLTLILKKHPRVPAIVTGGQETIALRIPNHPLTQKLLELFAGGVAAPSANRTGRISPTTAQHVRDGLGEAVDLILDGGACQVGIESTIVYLPSEKDVGSSPIILRRGHFTDQELSHVLGQKVLYKNELEKKVIIEKAIQVPGSDLSHYAPVKPLYLIEPQRMADLISYFAQRGMKVSVLSFKSQLNSQLTTQLQSPIVTWIIGADNPQLYAQQLYQQMHFLDQTNCQCILIEAPPATDPWFSILDRLSRASRSLPPDVDS